MGSSLKHSKVLITTVLNNVSNGCIPFENACFGDMFPLEKKIIVFDAAQIDAERVLAQFDSASGQAIVALAADGARFEATLWRSFIRAICSAAKQIVHGHHRVTALVAALVCHFLGRDHQFVYTLHGNLDRPHAAWGYKWSQILIMWLANRVVCNSRTTYDSIPRWAREIRDKSCVIYNGVNVSEIDQCISHVKRSSDGSVLNICTAGRLVRLKNFDVLLNAVAQLQKVFPNGLKLVLAGDGPERSKLEKLAAETGIAEIVSFVGEIPRRQVYRTMGEADLFVMPSRSEGFCNSLVEAMAAKVPVICPDISVFREIVPKESGIFFVPGDSSSLFQSLLWCQKNPRSLRSYGLIGRAAVEERFTLSGSVEEHRRLYLHMLDDIPVR